MFSLRLQYDIPLIRGKLSQRAAVQYFAYRVQVEALSYEKYGGAEGLEEEKKDKFEVRVPCCCSHGHRFLKHFKRENCHRNPKCQVTL